MNAHNASWSSGSWSVDVRGDELADIRYQGRLVLRSVQTVVRDADWNTADVVVDAKQVFADRLVLAVHSEEFGSDLVGTVEVRARGSELTCTFEAESRSAFLTNRTGLVVLHPPGVAGEALTVTHPDGTTGRTAFPERISAHQPVFDIAALEWAADGLAVSIAFEGDVFEMEDQRNWTDASFKTYNRPLALPFPYRLEVGERVRQAVTVHAGNADKAAPEPAPDRVALHVGGAFPSIGVEASTAPDPEPPGLDPIGQELLVELDLRTPNWRAALARAAARGLPLDVHVVVSDPAMLDGLPDALHGKLLRRVAVFDAGLHVSTAALVERLRSVLPSDESVPVVGGSRSHFTELNRERHRLPDNLDGLATTVTPLFHSRSTEQLLESVAMQRLVAEQTVAYAEGAPVHIGPIALRPRFNNVATLPQPGPRRRDLVEGYGAQFTGAADERQQDPILAAWTVASAAALAVPGVAGLAYFEDWGERGIRGSNGDQYPAAQAVRALAALSGGQRLWGSSPDGLVWAIGARDRTGDTILIANLGNRRRVVGIDLPGEDRSIEVAVQGRSWVSAAL